jgi:hypothetical protein
MYSNPFSYKDYPISAEYQLVLLHPFLAWNVIRVTKAAAPPFPPYQLKMARLEFCLRTYNASDHFISSSTAHDTAFLPMVIQVGDLISHRLIFFSPGCPLPLAPLPADRHPSSPKR